MSPAGDAKDLYEKGYFPVNTLTATDAETVQLFGDGEAAFLIDGSWKVNYFVDNHGETLEPEAGGGDRVILAVGGHSQHGVAHVGGVVGVAVGQKWAAGLNDIKDLYEKGYFPVNTLTATDAETVPRSCPR